MFYRFANGMYRASVEGRGLFVTVGCVLRCTTFLGIFRCALSSFYCDLSSFFYILLFGAGPRTAAVTCSDLDVERSAFFVVGFARGRVGGFPRNDLLRALVSMSVIVTTFRNLCREFVYQLAERYAFALYFRIFRNLAVDEGI